MLLVRCNARQNGINNSRCAKLDVFGRPTGSDLRYRHGPQCLEIVFGDVDGFSHVIISIKKAARRRLQLRLHGVGILRLTAPFELVDVKRYFAMLLDLETGFPTYLCSVLVVAGLRETSEYEPLRCAVLVFVDAFHET